MPRFRQITLILPKWYYRSGGSADIFRAIDTATSPINNNRLCGRRFYSQTLQQQRKSETWDVAKIRNIGIIAHIDAGKTTTTERMLYYCGFTSAMGDVDSGSTVTDYMEQERERGITITSAAVTFYYNKHRLNLIDTPGHVDFTLEVERCLRVLDGAVTILDASAGVEAQTMTVWRQAKRFRVPSIIYLNKMDKATANVNLCLSGIKEKLKIEPIMLQSPLGDGKSFRGVADLIRMELLEWPMHGDGSQYERKPVTPSMPDYDQLSADRRLMIDTIADHDDLLADYLLSGGGGSQQQSADPYTSIAASDLRSALRRCALSGRLAPTLCGASFKNKGVQPLLDAICQYLPNPDEREDTPTLFARYKGNMKQELLLCGLVFKIVHDKHHGPLTFIRIYSGQLSAGSKVYNVNKGETEVVRRVYMAHSDDMEPVNVVTAGNIAVVPDLDFAFTGDTITDSEATFEVAKRRAEEWANKSPTNATTASGDGGETDGLVLAGIDTPQPVFFCSIEAPSYSKQARFEEALRELAREDPSLRFREDPESGQTIMEGMGQLHIEIVKDRLLKEYDLDVFLGPLQINYREAIFNSAEAYRTLKDTVVKEQTKKETYEVSIALRVEPKLPGSGPLKRLKLPHVVGENYLQAIPDHYMDAAYRGCVHALENGPLLGRPVQDAEVILLDLTTSRRCPVSLVGACASLCLKDALTKAGCHLFQPMVYVECTLPYEHFAAINGELLRRSAEISEMKNVSEDRTRTICANVPLSRMIDFGAELRRLTSGTGTMHMEIKEYALVPHEQVARIVKDVTGIAVADSKQ